MRYLHVAELLIANKTAEGPIGRVGPGIANARMISYGWLSSEPGQEGQVLESLIAMSPPCAPPATCSNERAHLGRRGRM